MARAQFPAATPLSRASRTKGFVQILPVRQSLLVSGHLLRFTPGTEVNHEKDSPPTRNHASDRLQAEFQRVR